MLQHHDVLVYRLEKKLSGNLFSDEENELHEKYMRQAIEVAKKVTQVKYLIRITCRILDVFKLLCKISPVALLK